VLLNKIDVASAEDVAATERTLLGAFPQGRFLPTRFAEVPRDVLFGQPGEGNWTQSAARVSQRQSGHDHAGHDHSGQSHAGHDPDREFQSWSWSSEAPLDPEALRTALRSLPAGVLRAKGIFRIPGMPDARGVVQLAGKRTRIDLEKAPPPAQSSLVAIFRTGTVDPDALARLFASCEVR
jgi:G3E family GTPase